MAGQGRLLSRTVLKQSTYKLCPTPCYLLFCYLFRKYQESQWLWFYFQEPTRIPWEGFSLTPSFSSSGMKPESWGCLDSFINYIQRQSHLWLTPILMDPVRGQRMLCWGTVYIPSSLLAPISNLGSSQNHLPFWLFTRRIHGIHRTPSSRFYGARPESVEARDAGGWLQEGSKSGLFNCHFLALREGKFLPVASRAWDKYWFSFLPCLFTSWPWCDTVSRSAEQC